MDDNAALAFRDASSIAEKMAQALPNGVMELEYKLLAEPAVMYAVRESDWLRSFLVGEVLTRPILTRYYDTPTHALRSVGLVLRLRNEDGAWVQSLKSRCFTDQGLFRRMEWQQSLATDQLVLDGLLGVGGPLESLRISRREIAPVFETRFQRTTLQLNYTVNPEAQPTAIAVFLDEGAIVTSSTQAPIAEIEVELCEGSEDHFHHFVRQLCERFPVLPGKLSKADRGFGLLNAVSEHVKD